MFALFKRYREPLIVGALLVYPLVTFLSSGHRGRNPNWADRAVLAISAPVQSLLTWAVRSVANVVTGYVALKGAHDDAMECQTQLSHVQQTLVVLKEAQSENARLKALLRYAEASGGEGVVAGVIGLNPTAQFQSIRIDRGEDDGVRAGMPVTTAEGVVGHVVRAVGGSADVMLMTDPSSRIASVAQRSRIRATISGLGDGRRLTLNLVRREDDVQNGDEFVTSGTDGIFPRGLLIGTVRDAQRPTVGMFMSAVVMPSVDLSRVEEVMVIPAALSPVPNAERAP